MTQTISRAPASYERAQPETVLREAVRGFTHDQVTRALALIAANGLIKAAGVPGTYLATASDGVAKYVCDRYGCQCPAGRKQKPCYHRAAVLLLEADAKASRVMAPGEPR